MFLLLLYKRNLHNDHVQLMNLYGQESRRRWRLRPKNRVSGTFLFCKELSFFVNSAFKNEGLTLDMRLTRRQITTSLGQPANLGCYTTQANSSTLTYFWTKGNATVTPSSKIKVYAHMLVVTPEDDTDFGTYECSVSDGVSSTRCSIYLRPGCNKTAESEGFTSVVTASGCVNLAVLMPVLAVMMASLLLNVHFLIQWRRRQRWILSEEEIFQLHLAREALAANNEEQVQESVEVKRKKLFGGRLKKCKKEDEDKLENSYGNIQDSSKHDKDKGEAIEMQESKDFSHKQDVLRGFDIPREQDRSPIKEKPWEQDATRADSNQEILRLDDILRVQETNTPTLDSMSEWESPGSLDSARTKGIPRLEDIFHEQETSLPTQDYSHEFDSPRSLESPRTNEIPRLEEFLGGPEVEDKEKEHDERRPNVSGAHHRSGSLEAPRIAEFFLPGDESDTEQQNVESEEPLVSHYMERMYFETKNEVENSEKPLVSHYMEKMDFAGKDEYNVQDEEPLVSHYMEKMDFEKGHDDVVQDEEPLVSHYMEKMDFEGSKNDEEPVLK